MTRRMERPSDIPEGSQVTAEPGREYLFPDRVAIEREGDGVRVRGPGVDALLTGKTAIAFMARARVSAVTERLRPIEQAVPEAVFAPPPVATTPMPEQRAEPAPEPALTTQDAMAEVAQPPQLGETPDAYERRVLTPINLDLHGLVRQANAATLLEGVKEDPAWSEWFARAQATDEQADTTTAN